MQVKQVIASSPNSISPALIAASSLGVIMATCVSIVLGLISMSSTLQISAVAVALVLMILGVFFSVSELIRLGKTSR